MDSIVIFDDDVDLASILKDILTEEGYRVITFQSPPTVEQIAQLNADACLVDVWFGDEPKGAEFVEKLNETLPTKNIKVNCDIYVMSSDPDSKALAHSPFIRRFFQKPLDLASLVSVLRTAK
ncbi:response regulator [Candidatus Woesebacteria bacterium]|nr:response regulator [Candidatus Woesebacteria bacterium]MCD8507441.1 response regulator [Candidatus Woesebacteria bacterium]MCD8526868.1 response regulator [Candidatus Woesebacteria bacterium]MCD8545794.1 response regulator [Candidatus Woesebacteria bacterium]